MTLADIELADVDRFVAGVPWEWFARLREQAPLWWHDGCWVVTSTSSSRR